MTTNNHEDVAKICKALSHPVRVQILEYLKEIDTCICGDIVKMLPLSQSTVSQHLKQLKEAGLIRGNIEGTKTCYCIDKTVLNDFKEIIKSL